LYYILISLEVATLQTTSYGFFKGKE